MGRPITSQLAPAARASRGLSVRFLIIGGMRLGTDAGGDELDAGSNQLSEFGHFQRRTDQSAQAALGGHVGQAAYLPADIRVEADLAQRLAVETRQHGHAQHQRRRMTQLPRGFLGRLLGSLEHVRSAARMHGEHLHVEAYRGCDGLGDRVRDVMKFQIQKHRRAGRANPPHYVRPGGSE